MDWSLIVFGALFVLVCRALLKFRKRDAIKGRERAINGYSFPERVRKRVHDTYPHLTPEQGKQVIKGLREYFHICNLAGNRMVAMPSQAVDVAWHEFILFTREYKGFCTKAFGRFLHHTPAEAMPSRKVASKGIKRAWRISCYRESLDPASPGTLPLLFALDADLDIPDGFRYAPNCTNKGNSYCASHIGCSSGCGGGTSGRGDDGGSDSWFGGDSDGVGDSGCGDGGD